MRLRPTLSCRLLTNGTPLPQIVWAIYCLTTRGEPLQPNIVPDYITNEPLLRGGLEYLTTRRDNIRLTIVYGLHEKAEDLGDPEVGGFEKLVGAADYYGFEGFGHTEAQRRNIDAKASRVLLSPTVLSEDLASYVELARVEGIKSTFAMRRLRACAITHRPSFCPDIAQDGVPVEQSLVSALRANRAMPQGEDNAVRHLALQNAREWCMLAKTGTYLYNQEQYNRPRCVRVLFTVGGAHRDLTRKFRLLGTTVNAESINPLSWEHIAQAHADPLSTGIVTLQALSILLVESRYEQAS